MSLRFDDNVERTIEDEKKEGEEDEKEEEGGEEEEEEKEIPKVLLQHSYAENTQHSEILEEKKRYAQFIYDKSFLTHSVTFMTLTR